MPRLIDGWPVALLPAKQAVAVAECAKITDRGRYSQPWEARTMTVRGRINAVRAITISVIVVGLLLAAAVLVYVMAFGPAR